MNAAQLAAIAAAAIAGVSFFAGVACTIVALFLIGGTMAHGAMRAQPPATSDDTDGGAE